MDMSVLEISGIIMSRVRLNKFSDFSKRLFSDLHLFYRILVLKTLSHLLKHKYVCF